MELNKNDLLRLLSYLEGELQARDITIAALKVSIGIWETQFGIYVSQSVKLNSCSCDT